MNAGVSILVRAGDNFAAANEFLESLVKHNTYNPIEVLLWTKDSQQALATSRAYLGKLFVRVLPASTNTLSRIGQQARYDNLMIVDLPMRIKSDCLLRWIDVHKVDEAKALLCSKTHAKEFSDMAMTTALSILGERAAHKTGQQQNSATFAAKPAREILTIAPEANPNAKVASDVAPSGQLPTEEEFLQRYGWLKPPSLPKNIPALENHSDKFNNKEVHRCTLFPPYQPTKEKRDSPFKILALVGDRMQECLLFDADVVALDLGIWEEQLASSPSFVLIESDSKVLQMEGETAFKKFVAACNERGVPTVFWHTDAKEHCAMYRDIAKMVGFVGGVEQESVAYYEKHTKASVRLLEHAIQPALHNAIRENLPKPIYSNMRFFFDGWADLIEFRDEYAKFLQPLGKLGLHIFESRWHFMKNKLPETPQFIKNIHGVIDYRERLNAIKHFDVCIMAMPSMKSTSVLTLEALEAIASKRVVLFRGALDLPMLSGLINQCSNDDEFIDNARRLVEYPAYRDEFAHKAWRYVHTNHTVVNRLNALAEWIGLDAQLEQFPSVASVTVTKRPELLLTNAKKNYLQQTVPKKEWIIVLNTLDVNVEEVEESLKDVPNVRVYQVSSDKNIGFCLNMAIGKCQSDYWAKMDDDDFYGMFYLFDYILNIGSHRIELIGKSISFTYLEGDDSVYYRHVHNWTRINVKLSDMTLHMCGATFMGRRDLQSKVMFSETIRSAVDSMYIADCINLGINAVISDSYQMRVFRSSDKTKHTWRLDDASLKNNAVLVAHRDCASIVNV